MSDESNAPADLSNLGIDLSEMFRPSWTTEASGGSDATARLAAKFDEGERPARGDRHDRPGRQGGRDGDRGRDRGPRREGPRGAGGDGRDRAPRPGGRREGQGGGPRREGGRGRDDRRGPRDAREQRPEPTPKPALEGWKLELVPDAAAIEGIAKQVRSRAKAYPLFELARLILQLSDRYNVKLTPESEQTAGLFRVKQDASLWPSRKEAVSHLLSRHLGKFYRKSSVATEPPKGAFTVVAQCGMSGLLLGPPNHHEYTSRLISLHASRFKNMPFEVYKSRVRMVREEALIEQWKSEQSTKTVYIPLTPGSEPIESAVPASEVPAVEEIAAAPVAESESAVVEAEAPAHVESEESSPAETPAEEPAPEVTESPEAPEEGTPEESSAESTEETPAAASSEEGGLTLEEATAHFQEHHAANEVESAEGELTLSGRAALHESTPLLRELLLNHLREMDRFPLPLAQVLGKELTGRGLQLFKSHKKIINVSMARPRYLDRETTPIGENFRAILEYLEAHPNQRRDKQWTALLRLRTGTTGETPAATTAPAAVESQLEAVAVTESPAATPPQAPDAETLKRYEQALGADLLWLLHQGHVIDFAMGNLQAATRPAPKQPSKKEAAEAPPSSAATNETLTGDTDKVQPGGSATIPSEHDGDIITEPAEHHEPLEIPAGTTLETPPPVDPGEFLPKE